MIDVDRYVESIEAVHARHYRDAITALLLAESQHDRVAMAAARAQLEKVVTETMGIGECLGALSMLKAAEEHIEPERLRAGRGSLLSFDAGQPMLPRVTFAQALKDLVTRAAVTFRNAAERTAQNIAKLYSQGRVIAFARSAEHSVTERVKALFVEALRIGASEGEVGRQARLDVDTVRKETEAWTEGYARMAFRTNLNTSVTAGRFRQAQDQDIKQVIPCFRFDAVGDADCRANHEAANGLIFGTGNPVWNRIAPPLGYNCRCRVSFVSTPMLRRLGRIDSRGDVREDRLPPGAFPDPGFRHTGRPDLFITGG